MKYQWKTKDIKISKDSVGFFTATHPWGGTLIDSHCFQDRNEARRAAVEVLREKEDSDIFFRRLRYGWDE
mgnify:CR=1 FL=1